MKRLEDRSVERDFPTFIQTARASKTPLPRLYTLSESVDLLLAGTDTLSITLVNILFHLSKNPSLVHRLQGEVDNIEIDTLPSLEKLHLLTATIKEGLRMSHGVLGRLPRIAPSGGWTFDGVHVPAGTLICSSAPAVHNDPNIFPNPYRFVPERWLKEDGTYNGAMEQFLVAFSKGQRSCIGIK
jgi:cytochrome P450